MVSCHDTSKQVGIFCAQRNFSNAIILSLQENIFLFRFITISFKLLFLYLQIIITLNQLHSSRYNLFCLNIKTYGLESIAGLNATEEPGHVHF